MLIRELGMVRLFIAITLLLSSVDSCLASDLIRSTVQQMSVSDISPEQMTEKPTDQDHGSRDGHDMCQHCHSCHTMDLNPTLEEIVVGADFKTGFIFSPPSLFLENLKRPPRV